MTVAPAPSEHRRITRGAILKRLLAVGVAGLALYGLAPKLGEVLGNWPRLRDIEPGWFAVTAVTESTNWSACARYSGSPRGASLGPFLRRTWSVTRSASWCRSCRHSAALQFEMPSQEGVRPPAPRRA